MSTDGVTNPPSPDRLRPSHQYLKKDDNDALILDKNGLVQTVTEDFDDDDFVHGRHISLATEGSGERSNSVTPENKLRKDDNDDLFVVTPEYDIQLSNDVGNADPRLDLFRTLTSGAGTAGFVSGVPNSEGGSVSHIIFQGAGGTRIEQSNNDGNGTITVTSADIPTVPTTDASYALTVESTTVDGVTTQSRNWDDTVVMTGDLIAPFSSDPPNDQTNELTRFTASETFPVDFYTSGNTGEVRAGVNIGQIISGLGGIQTRLSITEAISKWNDINDYSIGQLVIFADVVYRRINTELIVSDVTSGGGTVQEPNVDTDWMAITNTAVNIADIKDTADNSVQSVVTETGINLKSGTAVTIPVAKKSTNTVAPTVDNDSSEDYSVGSLWINTTDNVIYICLDPSAGAANWREIGRSLTVQDEDNVITTAATKFTFVGAGVTSSGDGEVTVTIPGVDVEGLIALPDWWTILLQGTKPSFTAFDITDSTSSLEYRAVAQRSYLNITYFRIKNRGSNITRSDGWYRSTTTTSIGTANTAAQREF